MPNWKKVIVSGSIAHLSHVSSSGDFKTDKTGSFGRVETDAFSATTFTSTTVESTTISGSATSTGSFGRIETVGQVVLQRAPVQGFNY